MVKKCVSQAVTLAGLMALTSCSAVESPDAGSPVAQPHDTAASASESSSAQPVLSASATLSASVSAPAAPQADAPPPAKGTVILHVGDSFVHSGLTQRLRKHFEALGVRYEVRAEQSTNSLDWAKRVPGEVVSVKPDLVIITLGGNEIGSKHLDVQARAIKRIVSSIGDRPCVWLTPPLWSIEEGGLFDTLQENVAPCRFFETDQQVGSFLPRREDKIHPTMEGGALWADKLYAWLMHERTGDTDKPWMLKPASEDERKPHGKRSPLPH